MDQEPSSSSPTDPAPQPAPSPDAIESREEAGIPAPPDPSRAPAQPRQPMPLEQTDPAIVSAEADALPDDDTRCMPNPADATAIISDVHSNLEALTAVLADIESRGVGNLICLGDIIGYGPNPCECLDLIMERCNWSLMGNHDFAVLYEPTSFNASAESASFWTRFQFEREPDPEKRRRRFEYLGSLDIRRMLDTAVCVHASPRKPINEYIFPDDVISAPTKVSQIFDRIDHRCYCGHTHVPGIFTDEPDFYPPSEFENVYHFGEDEKCIVNPGSVGQPRDRDPRASYAIVYDDSVEFVRIEYDVHAVMNRITAIPQLADFLGQRLIEGR